LADTGSYENLTLYHIKKNNLVQATKAYTRSRGTAPLFLNLGARLSWVVNVTLWPLYPHKSTHRIGG